MIIMPSAVEGWGEKEICIKGVNYSQEDGEGEGGVIECLSTYTPSPPAVHSNSKPNMFGQSQVCNMNSLQ